TEHARLDSVRLGERLTDRLQGAGVGGRVGPARALDGALVDDHYPLAARHGTVDEGALARAGHAGDRAQHPQGQIHIHLAQVMRTRPAHLQLSRMWPEIGLDLDAVVEVPPG